MAEEIIITLLKLESMLFLRIWVEYPPPAPPATAATSRSISPRRCCGWWSAAATAALRLGDRATRISLLAGDKIAAWIALIFTVCDEDHRLCDALYN